MHSKADLQAGLIQYVDPGNKKVMQETLNRVALRRQACLVSPLNATFGQVRCSQLVEEINALPVPTIQIKSNMGWQTATQHKIK